MSLVVILHQWAIGSVTTVLIFIEMKIFEMISLKQQTYAEKSIYFIGLSKSVHIFHLDFNVTKLWHGSPKIEEDVTQCTFISPPLSEYKLLYTWGMICRQLWERRQWHKYVFWINFKSFFSVVSDWTNRLDNWQLASWLAHLGIRYPDNIIHPWEAPTKTAFNNNFKSMGGPQRLTMHRPQNCALRPLQ